MTTFHCSPNPPVAGRWVEVRYAGPGDILFWRVSRHGGPSNHCQFVAVELDGYGAARWRVPASAMELYVMDWDSRRVAPPRPGEGQVTLKVAQDLRL